MFIEYKSYIKTLKKRSNEKKTKYKYILFVINCIRNALKIFKFVLVNLIQAVQFSVNNLIIEIKEMIYFFLRTVFLSF